MQYRPAVGSSLSKEDAQKVGEYLEQMGEFTPTDVVNAARAESSPLHSHFTWDDLKAAEKYRLVEARHLVNTISVVVRVADKDVETRAFHSITVQSADESVEQRYTAIKIVSASADMREQVIQRALQELEGWTGRYEQYKEVFGGDIFSVIQKTAKRVRNRREQPVQVSA